MIVGIDGRFLQDKFHGIGRYTHGLLNGLLNVPGDHHIVLFVDPSLQNRRFPWGTLAEQSDRLTVVSTSLPMYSPREVWEWPAIIGRSGWPVDVFHSPYFWSPWRLPCPVVITVHDMIFDRYPQYIPGRRYALPYRLASAYMLPRASAIIAVSNATRDDVVRYSKVAPERVYTVEEAGDPAFSADIPEARRDEVRKRYGLPGAYVLAVGVRRPHKNVRRFLDAFCAIADTIPHAIVLVGSADPRFEDDARPLIDTLRNAGRLVELEHVAEPDLPAVYAMADTLAQPSIIEGFGLPVLEAMQCGCPVVCSSATSLPEVAGDAALTFDPLSTEQIAAQLHEILQNRNLRADLIQRGLRRAKHFTWERAALETLEVYEQAIGPTSRGDHFARRRAGVRR